MSFHAVFSRIAKRYAARESARRASAAKASEALNLSKRAIFALHRNDPKGAEQMIQDAKKAFLASEKTFKTFPELAHEGVYRAALEEHAEALLYAQYLKTGTFGAIDARAMDPEVYVGGLADAVGELVRHAVREATEGRTESVVRAARAAEGVVAHLMELDLTGHLRTKADQAKKHLASLEDLLYDVRTSRA